MRGLGTRLREKSEFRPKPMVEIGDDALWFAAEKISYLTSFKPFSENCSPGFILAVNLEDVLRRVETDHVQLQW